MALVFRNLSFALVMLVTCSAMASAHAAIIINGNIELPDVLDRSNILGDTDLSHGTLDRLENTPGLETAIEPVPQIASGEAGVPEFLPVITTLDEPVINSVKSAYSTRVPPDELGAPQPGPEPYVMLLVGLGLIVVAISLHLNSMQQTRSGFKPPQGMPFV